MDYSNLTEEQKIEMFTLRKAIRTIATKLFKLEPTPGNIVYKTISVGKKYRINNPSHNGINNRIVEVINFIYDKGKDEYAETPIGVHVRFMGNNKKGTYYNIIDLVEV